MTSIHNSQADETLGEILKRARMESGLTYGALSDEIHVARSQLYRLENDEIQTANPAHLALLADALDIPLGTLYRAAGYLTREGFAGLSDELGRKLRQLPPAALDRLDAFVDRLIAEGQIAPEAVLSDDDNQ